MYKEYPKFYNYEVKEYGRKSRTDDPLLSTDEILEKHSKIVEEYAVKYLGGPIPDDNKYMEVASGESLKDRPEITRLLKDIEDPAVKAIIVVEVQRLSRGDLEDAGRLIRLLRYTNTYVITPMKIYDLRDEYDRDAFERELKRGNEYLEYFKKIQARGRLASVKDGNYIGSTAPYGFDRIEKFEADGKKSYHTLIERKDQADVVRMIFNWYCEEDIGVTAICRRLEDIGAKTKTGQSTWKPSIIFSILENHHYIGCTRWNWRKTVKIIEDQEIKKLRPKAKVDEFLLFEGKHDGIISEEQFNKAREIRGKRHRTRRDLTLKNPFSGIMFCKRCGHKIGYNTYTRNGVEYAPPKLVCNNQVHCKSGSVKYSEVFEYVRKVLKDCIGDFEVRIENDQDDSLKLHTDLMARLTKQLADLEKKEMEQWEAQYDPDPAVRLPQHIFAKLNEKVLKEKEEVNKALEKAKGSAPKHINYRDELIKTKDALRILEDVELDAKTKNQYLKTVIDKMVYERDPIVQITKDNAEKYNVDLSKGMQYYNPPYKITIELKCD
jgi:DNA invertase Pin-like site-specific DNA recombinase